MDETPHIVYTKEPRERKFRAGAFISGLLLCLAAVGFFVYAAYLSILLGISLGKSANAPVDSMGIFVAKIVIQPLVGLMLAGVVGLGAVTVAAFGFCGVIGILHGLFGRVAVFFAGRARLADRVRRRLSAVYRRVLPVAPVDAATVPIRKEKEC